jgi:hypothetical protein
MQGQVCLEDKDGVSPNVYLQDINIMKKEEMKGKFKLTIEKRSYA